MAGGRWPRRQDQQPGARAAAVAWREEGTLWGGPSRRLTGMACLPARSTSRCTAAPLLLSPTCVTTPRASTSSTVAQARCGAAAAGQRRSAGGALGRLRARVVHAAAARRAAGRAADLRVASPDRAAAEPRHRGALPRPQGRVIGRRASGLARLAVALRQGEQASSASRVPTRVDAPGLATSPAGRPDPRPALRPAAARAPREALPPAQRKAVAAMPFGLGPFCAGPAPQL
jgi:hypothetical protein